MAETETKSPTRVERDSMGEMEVPADALYGASTQRAVLNFPISGQRFPRRFIRAQLRHLDEVVEVLQPAVSDLGHQRVHRVAADVRGGQPLHLAVLRGVSRSHSTRSCWGSSGSTSTGSGRRRRSRQASHHGTAVWWWTS